MEIEKIRQVIINIENIENYDNKNGLVVCMGDTIYYYTIDKVTQRGIKKRLNSELVIKGAVNIECVQNINLSMQTRTVLLRVYNEERESYIIIHTDREKVELSEEEVIDILFKYMDEMLVNVHARGIIKLFETYWLLIFNIFALCYIIGEVIIFRRIGLVEIVTFTINLVVLILNLVLIVKQKKNRG